jgi:hypothetical protein
MPENQADTLAGENLLLIAEYLATEEDLKSVKTDLANSISQLRIEMQGKFESIDAKFEAVEIKLDALESRIVTKLGVLMAAMVGTVAALLKIL